MIENGRILQAKVYGNKDAINITGVYQQARQPGDTSWSMQRRQIIFQEFDKLLQECSCNLPVIVGGDFNTKVCPNKNFVGNAFPPGKPGNSPKPVDWQALQTLIDRHQLCALNCHQAWHATYMGIGNAAKVSFRIDYVFTWAKLADQQSKQCSYIADLVLTARRQNVQRIPITCSVRAAWTPWSSPRINLTRGSAGCHIWPATFRVQLTWSKPYKA